MCLNVVALVAMSLLVLPAHAWNCQASMILGNLAARFMNNRTVVPLGVTTNATAWLRELHMRYPGVVVGSTTRTRLGNALCWFDQLAAGNATSGLPTSMAQAFASWLRNDRCVSFHDGGRFAQSSSLDGRRRRREVGPFPVRHLDQRLVGSSPICSLIPNVDTLNEAWHATLARLQSLLSASQPSADKQGSFWLTALSAVAGAALDPMSSCTLYSRATFPTGDRHGRDFMLRLSVGPSTYRNVSLFELHETVGNLLNASFPDAKSIERLASALFEEYQEDAQAVMAGTSVVDWTSAATILCRQVSYLNGELTPNSIVSAEWLLRLRRTLQRQLVRGGLAIAMSIGNLASA